MSTRSTTHFLNTDGSVEAIVYRHSDGYPEGAGRDLAEFIANPKAATRIGDPSYLAARYVVFLAAKFDGNADNLDFLSVGICQADPCDIEYRYTVDCQGVVKCFAVSCDYTTDEWSEELVYVDRAFVEAAA